jgi:outer membrane immunogenic protein
VLSFRYGVVGLTLSSALALAAFSANAADMYVPGPGGYKDGPVYAYNWSGFYGGIQGGGLWGTENVTFPVANTHTHPNFSGGVYGAQFGAQQQFSNNIVLGGELSVTGSSADGSAPCPNPAFSCKAKAKSEIQVVTRLGYAWGNFLPYVKGGASNTSLTSTTKPPFAGFDDRNTHDGWVVGGGLEYALTHNIILGVDYSHIMADSVTYGPIPVVVPGVTRNIDADIDIVTARISYKFTPDSYQPMK